MADVVERDALQAHIRRWDRSRSTDHRGGARSWRHQAEGEAELTGAGGSQERASGGSADGAEAVLVAVDEDSGVFLARGDVKEILATFDGEPVSWLTPERARDLDDALALGTGIANTALQTLHGINQATGLVRLAPETLAAMRAGAQPLMSGGQQLGTLAKGGKIVAQVRFLPAGAAGATAALAAIGPAIAIAAVQWQLSKINRAVQQNLALTQKVLDELREESWFELESACGVMHDEALRAMRTGMLAAHQWDYVQAQSSLALLRKHHSRRRLTLLRTVGKLRSGSPRAWLSDDFAQTAEAARGMTLTARAMLLHSTLRAAHVRSTDPEHGTMLANDILDEASSAYAASVDELDHLLREMHSRLSLLQQVDAKSSFSLRKGAPAAPVAAALEAVGAIHDSIRRGPGTERAAISKDPVTSSAHPLGFSSGGQVRALERVRWLAPDEAIRLVASCTADWDTRKFDLLLVTERQAMLVDRRALDDGRVVSALLPTDVVATGHREGDYETVRLSGDDRRGSLRIRHGEGMRVRDELTELRGGDSGRPSAVEATGAV